MKPLASLLAIALAGCSTGYWGPSDDGALLRAAEQAALTNRPLVVTNCTGTSTVGLNETQKAINFMAKHGVRVELRGRAESACTMMLRLENICYAPNSVFAFHGGYDLRTWGYSSVPSETMRQSYPPNLQQWTRATGALNDPKRWVELSGSEIAMLDKRPRICR